MDLEKHLELIGGSRSYYPAPLGFLRWAKDKTAGEAWWECHSPQWSLWWAASTEANTQLAVLDCAVAIAKSMLYMLEDQRPAQAIAAVEAWANALRAAGMTDWRGLSHPEPELAQAARDASRQAAAYGVRESDYKRKGVAWTCVWLAYIASGNTPLQPGVVNAMDAAAEVESKVDLLITIQRMLVQPWREEEVK